MFLLNTAEDFLCNILYFELYYNKASIFFYALDNKKTRDYLLKKIDSMIKRIPKSLLDTNKDFTNINPEKILKRATEYAENDFSYGVYKTTPTTLTEEEYYEYKNIEIPWMYLDPDYYILKDDVSAYTLGEILCQKVIKNDMSLV